MNAYIQLQLQSQVFMKDFETKFITKYINILLDYNTRINLVSRKITYESLTQLLHESISINKLLTNDVVVDAGSGNGILGVPIAILNGDKKVILVETIKKKHQFLLEIKNRLGLSNLEVYNYNIEAYFKKTAIVQRSLISRGFPDYSIFCEYLRNGFLDEAIIITSKDKIKKLKQHMENIEQKTYNLPLRTHLKILKMEKFKINK